MKQEQIIVVDFGGQYTQLIARCIREAGVYAQIIPHDASLNQVDTENLKGFVFSGGPDSVYDDQSKQITDDILRLHVPILGICYGMQLLAQLNGGQVGKADVPEFGPTAIHFEDHPLFEGMPDMEVWMNHNDRVLAVSPSMKVIAHTDLCPIAAYADDQHGIYGVQFHPELKSRPNHAHPLFRDFIRAAKEKAGK